MRPEKRIFVHWQGRLEFSEELYALRLFEPNSGLIWRNESARKYYTKCGFFPATTLPWNGVVAWLSPEELKNLENCYEMAFATGEAVEHLHISQVEGYPVCKTITRFVAIYGNTTHGVLLSHLQPLPFSVASPSQEQLWDRAQA